MKKSKWFINILLCIIMTFLQSACGNVDEDQDIDGNKIDASEVADSIETGNATEELQESTQLLHSDWLTSAGEVLQTWQKDYASSEWEDGVCLNMYVYYPIGESSKIGMIEDELNHRLYLNGYDFYVHFIQPDVEEFYDRSKTVNEYVAQRAEEGITIDLYVTSGYREAIENGALLDLTDYMQSEEGYNLYAHYDPSVWRQLETGEGSLYGVPTKPIAATRYVYAYNPQLADILNIDMAAFNGDLLTLEDEFAGMTKLGIAPLELRCQKDFLMLSLFGYENYREIFAVRHTENDWEAVDLFQQEEIVSFYEQLGIWKERNFLIYNPTMLNRLRQMGIFLTEEMSSDPFSYVFLSLLDTDKSSWYYDLNMAGDGYVETAFYVPQGQGFVTEITDEDILVINVETLYPQESMQFLNLLSTDEEIRTLLYCGIENYQYTWQEDVCVFESSGFAMGLGLDADLRFWPVGHWGEKYVTEIEELNQNVSDGISLTVDCDFAGLEEQYEACCQLFEENILVFLGYYGAETGERLQALHEQLNEAGYQELLAAINTIH